MCGIFALLNADNKLNAEIIKTAFYEAQSRGPERSNSIVPCIGCNIGFHRLAINGLNKESDQPLLNEDVLLVCNGEIYNYTDLYNLFPDNTAKTDSDCEIIIHMYKKYGIDYTLNNLDGVFAFVLIDLSINKMYVSRDPYGVRPLYHMEFNYNTQLKGPVTFHAFASEMKQMVPMSNKLNEVVTNNQKSPITKQFTPGTYSEFSLHEGSWKFMDHKRFSTHGFLEHGISSYDNLLQEIHERLVTAVKKRIVGTTDRPVACLLSGGLDSSLVTSIVSRYVPELETYSIGLKGSEDLKYAKLVADFLGTKHTEIIVDEDHFFNSIPEVIKKIESFDTTTVRASVGNYLVSKWIKEHSDAKVIFNGDGSDEVSGGYMYFHAAPNPTDFDLDCRRLLNEIHFFDVLRSDRSISTNGLEPRTPFLDRSFVQFYLSIPKEIRCHNLHSKCEKYLIREAFNDGTWLPEAVLFRTKEAFSDGVSSQTKSWFEIISEKVSTIWTEEQADVLMTAYKYEYMQPETLEQLYYRTIFDKLYPNMATTIPHFWMPNFVDAKDSSARTLDVYNKQMSSS